MIAAAIRKFACAVAVGAIGIVPSAARADYPERPVTVVVGYAPGGSVDLVARIVTKQLSDHFGKPFVVDNRPGANGNIAAAAVARARPDGYTLLFGGSNHVMSDSLYKNLSFSFSKDFVPLALSASMSNVLTVNPRTPVHSLQELIALAQKNPGKLNYGSSGEGSSQHLSAEMLKKMARIDVVHVPYRGAAPALTDLLAGQIDLMFVNAPTVAPHVASGKLRALGVTSAARDPGFPDVLPLAEQGLAGYDIGAWVGLFAPKGLPPEIAATLNKAADAASRTPQYQKQIKEQVMTPLHGDLRQIDDFVRSEDKKWAEFISAGGYKLQ